MSISQCKLIITQYQNTAA